MLHAIPLPRQRARRHRAPLPLTDSADLFAGGDILREFEGDLAIALWKSYKNVMLWAGAAEDERSGLFVDRAGDRRRSELTSLSISTEMVSALNAIAALLDAPAEAPPVGISFACREISDWAIGRSLFGTGLLFAQAAAVADPRDAEASCTVGRMARDRAEYARAETWFRHAIVTARETRNWRAYSRSYLGLAKVFWQRGALPSARRCVMRAYRTATRHHLTELRGYALWDLGGLAIHAGRWEDVQRHARAATEVFGSSHPSVYRFMNDVAYAWVSMGWFAPALRVLRVVAPQPQEPAVWASVWGSLARAAGGAGEEAVLDDAVAHIEDLERDPASAAGIPDAWLDVAHGAATLRRWELAERAAALAGRLAAERGEGRIRLDAEATLESIRSSRAAERPMLPEVRPFEPAEVRTLAAQLVELAAAV